MNFNLSKCIFCLVLFFASCSSEHKSAKNIPKSSDSCIEISAEEKAWMGKFFTDYFLEGPAIYTLFGSKPMSIVTIVIATEKEWQDMATPYLKGLSEEKKEEMLRKVKQHCLSYDLAQNWEKWLAWRKNCSRSPFLFAKRNVNKNLINTYILNAPEVVWTLQEHYALFSRELKMEFDPIEVTLDFENPNSVFWEKVFSSHLLQGILHGFGERNSYFFHRQFGQEGDESKYDVCLFESSLVVQNQKEGCSIENIRLPAFRSYNLPYGEDPMIVKYEEERTMIQKQLIGKDFTEEVLKRLCKCDFRCSK